MGFYEVDWWGFGITLCGIKKKSFFLVIWGTFGEVIIFSLFFPPCVSIKILDFIFYAVERERARQQ